MTPDEFVNLWGPDDFVRATGAGFDQLPVPAPSRSFLQNPGLPRLAGLQLDFSTLERPVRDLKTLLAAEGKAQPAVDWDKFLVIGRDNASYLCAVRDLGEIWAIWPRERLERFVNRGIPELASCLLGYRQISRGSEDLDEESYAQELRRYINQVDEAALEGEEHWWAVVVEQAGYGDL